MKIKKTKVLIVDDSVIYRSQLKLALSELDGVEVVGVSSNGKLAIERLKLDDIDLMILDLEMPVMDGLSTLRAIRKFEIKVKVIVFSTLSKRGASITMEALNLGANDFVAKPGKNDSQKEPQGHLRSLFQERIQSLFPSNELPLYEKEDKETPSFNYFSTASLNLLNPKIIVIGSSTGGPNALEKIFKQLKNPLPCPIIIVQHMPPVFTAALAQRLEKVSGIKTYEIKNKMNIEPSCAYIAPGDYHVTLKKLNHQISMHLDQSEKVHSVRPAVDPLFTSASALYTNKCLAIVLTGMGKDGAQGAKNIKENKGAVIIQEKESCVVFGMPGSVKSLKSYDQEMSLDSIAKFINERMHTK